MNLIATFTSSLPRHLTDPCALADEPQAFTDLPQVYVATGDPVAPVNAMATSTCERSARGVAARTIVAAARCAESGDPVEYKVGYRYSAPCPTMARFGGEPTPVEVCMDTVLGSEAEALAYALRVRNALDLQYVQERLRYCLFRIATCEGLEGLPLWVEAASIARRTGLDFRKLLKVDGHTFHAVAAHAKNYSVWGLRASREVLQACAENLQRLQKTLGAEEGAEHTLFDRDLLDVLSTVSKQLARLEEPAQV